MSIRDDVEFMRLFNFMIETYDDACFSAYKTTEAELFDYIDKHIESRMPIN